VEVVKSTPRLIISLAVLGVLAVLLMAATVASIAAWNGRGVTVLGFKVDEAKPPEVQQCAAMTSAIKSINDVNSDFMPTLKGQIEQILSAYQTDTRGYVPMDAEKKIQDLLSRQQQIIDTRNRAIDRIAEACGIKVAVPGHP
jgi:hypothetical protein